MAYDSARGVTVLFGGEGLGVGRLADTWEWDGNGWTERFPASHPAPRLGHSMAFDSARGRVVLFGGSGTSTVFDDTWEYDGATWLLVAPANRPPARHGHSTAFLANQGRMLVSGGAGSSGVLGDAWVWDGSAWLPASNPSPAPTERNLASMTFDAASGTALLFGGTTYGVWLSDTWTWDAAGWQPQSPSVHPTARAHAQMVFDDARARVLLFGGDAGSPSIGSVPSNDLWEWSGNVWTQASPLNSPPARFSHAMAHDSQRSETVLFGGYASGGVFGDTWVLLEPVLASTQPYGAGCGAPPISITPQAGARPVLGATQVTNITNAYLGLAFIAWGTTQQSIDLAFAGFAGCTLWHGAEGEIAAGCTQTSWNSAQHSLFIPVDPLLVGVHIYLQAWTLAPGYNPIGLATSNGIDLLIGDV